MASREKHYVNGVFDQKSFLLDPKSWPQMDMGNFVALRKRRDDGNFAHAFILTIDNLRGMHGEITVCLGYFFDGGTGETVVYESVDKLLEDGWTVD